MSRMKFDRKPPLAKSPIRLRPRLSVQSNSSSLQTPPGSLTKSQKPSRVYHMEEPDLRPEYRTISCELRALAKKVQNELGGTAGENTGQFTDSSPLFERGRFYEEYSARRNERLKRKKGLPGKEEKISSAYNLGVTVESSKRRDTKKIQSSRKSVSAAYSLETTMETPRYMLRSMTKENKKPPLPVVSSERSLFGAEKKIGTARRVRKV
ncbi:uncharacterized protein LOC120010856 [Tripterygium wilfordii]|uniref:uncharacterized protein LOC120010856 n=1 Tax=Tripterygium wilfordii TaxID=458696 RepID=UPI0018F7F6C9|nr:uncharacterized protein LOC120010856 [Tripterygium wilfordii]